MFFSRGTLFVEGQEDAHIIANYLQENALPDIEIFGYGAGGASLIVGWLRLARQLGIRAAAIFDGDPEGVLAFKKCSLEFLGDEQVWLRNLPTSDIRDKQDKGVEGIFDERWQIKDRYLAEWNAVLSDCEAFLRSWPPRPGAGEPYEAINVTSSCSCLAHDKHKLFQDRPLK